MNVLEMRKLLDAAIAAIALMVRAILTDRGIPTTPTARSAVALLLVRAVRDARELSHAIGVRHLVEKGVAPDMLAAAPAPYPPAAIERTLERIVPADADPADVATHHSVEKRLTGALNRHAEQPAREAVIKTSAKVIDGAWARVLTGDRSCAFCAMLASRGPVYKTENSASWGPGFTKDGDDAVHDGCDCAFVFVPGARRNKRWEGYSQWQKLQSAWRDAENDDSDGRSTKAVFRTWWEKQVADGHGAKYIAPSVRENLTAATVTEIAKPPATFTPANNALTTTTERRPRRRRAS